MNGTGGRSSEQVRFVLCERAFRATVHLTHRRRTAVAASFARRRCRHASSGRQSSAAKHTIFTGSDCARPVDRNGRALGTRTAARHCVARDRHPVMHSALRFSTVSQNSTDSVVA